MGNLDRWTALQTPPAWAIKPITGGRLKGKSDINPQWRYRAMTEIYGPYGLGWKFAILERWTEPANDGQIMVFVKVGVSVCVDGQWSEHAESIGGDFLIEKETSGLHSNDEAYKMATTDAIGNALKYFGVASEVYEGGKHNGTKYDRQPFTALAPPVAPPVSPAIETAPAPASAQVQTPANGVIVEGIPVLCEARSGTSTKTGKAWTLWKWKIAGEDGRETEVGTFSETTNNDLKFAHESKMALVIRCKPTAKGGLDVVSFTIAEPAPAQEALPF